MNRNTWMTTPRIGFSIWSAEDLPLAELLWGDPAVTKYICATGIFSPQDIANRLRTEIRNLERYHVQYWPIFELATGELIGCCGLRPHGVSEYEIGFHLRPSFWRQGYAHEAAAATIKHAFATLHAERLFAGHNPKNGASRKVLEKLGFAYTGDEYYEPTGLYHPSYRLTQGSATWMGRPVITNYEVNIMSTIDIRRIDEAHAMDARLPNEPFQIWGRMIPSLSDGKWSYTTVRLSKTSEECYPEENYDVTKDDGIFLGAYDGDTCVGVAVLRKEMFRYLYLDDLKVSCAHRGKGVGQKLIEACMKEAGKLNLRGVYTIGQDDNLSACLFYLKCGFEIGGFDNRVYGGTSAEHEANIYFYRDLDTPQ